VKWLNEISQNGNLLRGGLRGIERECLRVDNNAKLAQTAHPRSLGSALTHPYITTDYSESLLELITGTNASAQLALDELQNITQIAYQHLSDELLWSSSMPCILPREEDIPLAQYGSSNSGRLKYVYRLGLALRYGRIMQCIAGIHYNFSFNDELFGFLQQLENSDLNTQDFKSQCYIDVMRNFVLHSWVLLYLFGATPVLDASFLQNHPCHNLQQLDTSSFYSPHATSLRMSKLGYKSSAQAGIIPCYNRLATYIERLRGAITTPYADYVNYGERDEFGNWQQLNTNILQIENEFYSSIRPKRIPKRGEAPLAALQANGVQYIEVRCLDINPYSPVGLDVDTAHFVDIFLTYCLLNHCKHFTTDECRAAFTNFEQVASSGRDPNLKLQYKDEEVPLTECLTSFLDDLAPVAQMLDAANSCIDFSQSLQAQQNKLRDKSLLPSSLVLEQIRSEKLTFIDFALKLSYEHQQYFKRMVISDDLVAKFNELAANSHLEQNHLEQQDRISFDEYVANYQRQFYQS